MTAAGTNGKKTAETCPNMTVCADVRNCDGIERGHTSNRGRPSVKSTSIIGVAAGQRPVLQRLPGHMTRLLRRLGELADEEAIGLYLVGGVVRDLLLNRRNWDLDLTVEGDGLSFARLVTSRYDAGLALFPRFGTARLTFPGGLKVDITTARRETYANPAALPDVLCSTLDEDLRRRDFTINAMAIQLNPVRWGQLRDPYDGRRDLRGKILRVLHDRSFVDDPTRIFRAIRFAERFGFRLERKTERLLAQAARTNVLARLSGPRLANEILALMSEQHPEHVIGRLRRWRLLRFVHPGLVLGERTQRLMAVLPKAIGWWERRCSQTPVDRGLLGMMTLLASAGPSTLSGAIQRLQLSAAQASTLEWSGEKSRRLAAVLSSGSPLRRSRVYRLLSGLPNEAVVLVLARRLAVDGRAAKQRLGRRLMEFLMRDRHVTTRVNGDTLKRFGLRPGPHFKTILDRLLDERLDGKIADARQERDRARALAEQYG
jgi:tRNA nucleotidyltransferase (CCA-adding enzyme)